MSEPAIHPHAEFLDRPGLAGMCGALMDEYARAAIDFCRTVESLPAGALDWAQPSADPDTTSVRAMCVHACRAAHGYAYTIRMARGLPHEKPAVTAEDLRTPRDVRPHLARALRYTEGALEGLYDADEKAIADIKFPVRWGPTYDPEMLLEHAIVHLLRHRRQLERWPRPGA
jgi:hypothetical protein